MKRAIKNVGWRGYTHPQTQVKTAFFNVIFRFYTIVEHYTSVCGCLYAREPKFFMDFFMYHDPYNIP